MSQVLKITQIRSSLRREKSQGLTLRALGLRKRHQTVLQKDTPEIRGMIKKIQHLVTVEVEEK
jgi:large subunit ribosomal protein L30